MSAQVNHDLLADYVGGALDGTPEFKHVASLVATDPEWRRAADRLTDALEAVDRDLRVLRDLPEPMPVDVSARFDQLFAPGGRDPLAPRVLAAGDGERGRRSGWRRPGGARRWKRWAAPVAIATVAIAAFGVSKLPSVIAPGMSSDAGAGRFSEAPTAAQDVHTPVPTTTTGFNYSRETVKLRSAQPPAAEGPSSVQPHSGTGKADSAGALDRLSDPLALQQCLATVVAVLPGRVDAVEYAAFEGSPALVISINTATGPWRYVAGPNCGLPGPDERFRTPQE